MKKQATNVASTQHLGTLTGSTFTCPVKTYWDHQLLPKLRGRCNCEKREAALMRQTAEWGMLTMQVSFLGIWDRFIYKEHDELRIVFNFLSYSIICGQGWWGSTRSEILTYQLTPGVGQGPIGREAGETSKFVIV
jgi:hypothetical protein